jgi:hypothetical protein
VNDLIATSGEESVDASTTPLHCHLDVGCVDALPKYVVIAVPEVN